MCWHGIKYLKTSCNMRSSQFKSIKVLISDNDTNDKRFELFMRCTSVFMISDPSWLCVNMKLRKHFMRGWADTDVRNKLRYAVVTMTSDTDVPLSMSILSIFL